MLIQRYVRVGGVLHPVSEGWPTTGARCRADGAKLLYTVHGECFYCENEEDEHLYLMVRLATTVTERRCTCCLWEE